MPFDENEATPSVMPASERWKLFREMIQEPDDKRRQDLVRRYYGIVNRDLLARNREVETHLRDGR